MSRSIEDYLKGIYTLKKKKEYSNKKLAEYLNISPASVSEMIKKLANDDYLTIDKKTVKLTEKGNSFALDIIRKHRVWEVFLFEKLGYEKKEVHKEAEILEHVTSNKLLQKLEKFLFYPKECPHGSPIFYDLENLDEENIIKLSETEEDDEIVILSVEDNIELYDYLRDLNINLKEEYIVEKKDPFDGPIYLKSKANNEKVVAFNAATMIKVYKKNEVVIITSLLATKDFEQVFTKLEKITDKIFITSLKDTVYGLTSSEIRERMLSLNIPVNDIIFEDDIMTAYENALSIVKDENSGYKAIVICGSFYEIAKFNKIIAGK